MSRRRPRPPREGLVAHVRRPPSRFRQVLRRRAAEFRDATYVRAWGPVVRWGIQYELSLLESSYAARRRGRWPLSGRLLARAKAVSALVNLVSAHLSPQAAVDLIGRDAEKTTYVLRRSG